MKHTTANAGRRVSFARVALTLLLLAGSGCIGTQREDTPDRRDRIAGERLGAALEATTRDPAPSSTVILLSLDGVRWDYLDNYETPHLDAFAAEGVRAERLIPVFPTKTFPNHYSVVTGLYAENHGIISNTMVDSEIEGTFSLSNREVILDPKWWQGEPLWVTAEKQGLTTATYFWPGSEVAIQNMRPTHWREYDGRIGGEERVDQVLAWLDLPESRRPSFITLYFSEVDAAGHRHGPDAPEVAEAMKNVDNYFGRLMEGLRAREIEDEVNVIVTSDHGMAATSEDRVIILDLLIDVEAAHIVDFGPALMMYPPTNSDLDSVVRALDAHPRVSAYRKDAIPDRYRIAGHPRTPPILAIADEGWSFSTQQRFEENPSRFNGGAHGYDHELESMGGIFAARGPAFRSGFITPPLMNVHIYELVCEILGLKPAPNDGDLESVAGLLRSVPAASQ